MRPRLLVVGSILAIVSGAIIAAAHDVTLRITPESRATAARLMNVASFKAPRKFDDELALVRAVQGAILDAAPIDRGIAEGAPRELSDLVIAGHGLCYDRSRAIETVLQLYGMKTRHASIYALMDTHPVFALLTPGTSSHAVSEVLTQRGWMVIDSNAPWLGIEDGEVLDLAAIASATDLPTGSNPIFQSRFLYVYGLYSRHGQFYPPYNVFPDISWVELAANLSLA